MIQRRYKIRAGNSRLTQDTRKIAARLGSGGVKRRQVGLPYQQRYRLRLLACLTGSGYESCALLYAHDPDRYDHNGYFCTEESIQPFFIRQKQASVFLLNGDEDILASRQLTQQEMNGYITTTISSYFKEDAQLQIQDPAERKILCARDYQMWWVQRTGYKRFIQKKKGFRVASPPCEYDPVFE